MNGSTPTSFELHAALIVARLVPDNGCSDSSFRASFSGVSTGGLYREQHLIRGQQILELAGLIIVSDAWCRPTAELQNLLSFPQDLAAELLLQRVLLTHPPLWLFAAISDETVQWENIPDDDARALRQAIDEADRREALLLALGRKFDQDRFTELGSQGEDHVVDRCRDHLLERGREDLAQEVKKVSDYSDQLGYDVSSPDTIGIRHRLEVKTTVAPGTDGNVSFYLSRNEANVGLGDASWALVAVRKDVIDESYEIVGWCRAETFADVLPADPPVGGHWASARITIPVAAFQTGLPLDQSS